MQPDRIILCAKHKVNMAYRLECIPGGWAAIWRCPTCNAIYREEYKKACAMDPNDKENQEQAENENDITANTENESEITVKDIDNSNVDLNGNEKQEVNEPARRRRGRPPKKENITEQISLDMLEKVQNEQTAAEESPMQDSPKRKRGRPPKAK